MPINARPEATPPKLFHLESSALTLVGYDAGREVLHAEFRDGSAYEYSAVPRRVYRDLLASDSKGRYFNCAIRGYFRAYGQPHRN